MKSLRKNKAPSRNRFTPLLAVLLILLIVYVVLVLAPLVWSIIASFKSEPYDFHYNKTGFPKQWIFDNYSYAFTSMAVPTPRNGTTVYVGVFEMYGYSLLYALGCALAAAFSPCITAYCCARFKCTFSKILYNIVIICMVLPIVGNLPSEIQVARTVGVYGQIWGLWIMKAGFLGIYYLVFYGAFNGLPKSYFEAAKMDGAGNWRQFFQIAMPLVKNVFFTVVLIKFIEFWNDYQTPAIFMESYPTMALGVFKVMTHPQFTEVPQKMAAAMILFVPVFAVFLIFQKKFMGDLMIGGVKE